MQWRRCPAWNCTWWKCGKKRHWAKFCLHLNIPINLMKEDGQNSDESYYLGAVELSGKKLWSEKMSMLL